MGYYVLRARQTAIRTCPTFCLEERSDERSYAVAPQLKRFALIGSARCRLLIPRFDWLTPLPCLKERLCVYAIVQ
jgi:hypothetical protein